MMAATPRLALTGLRKSFGATAALAGVDLRVDAGQVLALIGENGAGKSTLIKALTGAHRPDAGAMRLDGAPYAPADPIAARAAGVAAVYQELTLCPHLSVAENIVLGAWPARAGIVDRRQRDRLARAALDQLGVELPLAAAAGGLPVAQRQLCEIARALAATGGAPRVLILDEPTSSLGAADVHRLHDAIRRLRAAGSAIIYISHALEECRAIADRFAVLRDGTSVGDGAMAEAADAALIRLMAGRDLGELYPPRAPDPGSAPIAIEIDALGGRVRPAAASLRLRRGEVLGLYGLVGAGRTELLRALFGLDPAVRGRVLIAGRDATRSSPHGRLDQAIALLSEDRKGEGLCLGRSIADNLVLSRPEPACRGAWFSPRRAAAIAATWIGRLGVRCRHPQQAIGELSGGNQQKVAIARMLHHLDRTPGGARVLLLDEPTRGIDVGAKAAIYRLIADQAAAGTGVILASSYLPELLGTCHRIAVMRRGVLGPARPAGGLDAAAILAEAIAEPAAAEGSSPP